jgi:hypothetical protein
VLQSIITAAKKYSSYATTEYNRQGMLREVQEASDEDSDSLAWFTNTVTYSEWEIGDEQFIYYPITPDLASSGHDTIAAALLYHLRAKSASKVEAFHHIFYFNPSKAESDSVTYPAFDYQEMDRSLISQALMTYDCMRGKLLLMKMSQGVTIEMLRLLLTTDQNMSLDDFLNVLDPLIKNIPHSTGSKNTPHSVILVIDRIGQVDDKFRGFITRILYRSAGHTLKSIVSVFGSSPGILPLMGEIDEDTECNGKHSYFLYHANAEAVVRRLPGEYEVPGNVCSSRSSCIR